MATKKINKLDAKDIVHIVTAVDEDYLQHLYVMFTSLTKNADLRKIKIIMHLIHQTINDERIKGMKEFFVNDSVQIEEYKVNFEEINDFYISGHINITTYYRILIPRLLNSKINKVIYLDSDIVINADICNLWCYDLKDQALGAIVDLQGHERKVELGIPDTSSYFNAGVLLMNLNYWRNNYLADKVMKYIKSNSEKLKYWDQDALNAVLHDKWLRLPYRWNVQTNAYFRKNPDNEIKNSLKNPSIIHYTTASKPWHLTNNHPLKERYLYYLKMTPFSDFTFVKEATKHIINEKKKIFVFGAGENGQNVAKLLGISKFMAGYIDNDPKKQGKEFDSKKVYSLNDLKELNCNDVGIIVTSSNINSISKQLIELNLKENIDFVHQM